MSASIALNLNCLRSQNTTLLFLVGPPTLQSHLDPDWESSLVEGMASGLKAHKAKHLPFLAFQTIIGSRVFESPAYWSKSLYIFDKSAVYVDPGGVGRSITINRAELTDVASVIRAECTHIATNSACSLS